MSAAVLTFQSISLGICLVLTWPANLFLCWLIIYRTNSVMRVWSQILLQSVIIDLLLPLLLFLLQPMLINDFDTLYAFMNSPIAHFNQTTSLILLSVCCFCMEFSKYAIAVQFAYRWLVICRDCQLSIPKYTLLLCVPASMALIITIMLNIGLLLEANCDLHCSSCPADLAVICGWPMGSIGGRIMNLAIIFFNLLTYSIIFIVNLLIWRKSRQTLMPGQQQSREISRQVGQVLLVQALFPLALSLLPTLIFEISGLIGNKGGDWLMVPYFQYWVGLVNPVATILIVSQYRHILVKAFGKRNATAVQPISNTQQQQQNRIVRITGS